MATLDELAAAFAEDMAPQTAAEVAAQAGCLEAALALARRGWLVFPCNADKTPTTAHGHLDATCSPAEIRRLFSERPGPMVGINTGAAGLVVLDNDVKNGVDGYETSAAFSHELGVDLTDTMLVDTPSGGQHGYFLAGPYRVGCDNRGKLVGPGVDVKGEGGYVIAPGSSNGHGAYLLVDGHGFERLRELPPALGERLAFASRPASRQTGPRSPHSADDSKPIPQGSRNATLTSMAGKMRRDGWNPAEIEAALLVANAKRCRPPLPEEEPRKIAASVGRYEPARPVQEATEVSPADEPSDESASVRTGVFIDFTTAFNRDHNEAEWVYPDVLARGRGHAVYAPHKGKKSLLTLYIAKELATGPQPVVVVYLDYEMSENDVIDRLEDMGHGPHSDLSRLHYALLPTLPPLDTAQGAKEFASLIDSVQGDWPDHHLAVVIDTISRAIRGEENSADTFRDFYRHTGTVLKRRGVTWVRLDHAGKDPGQGQRGSSGKGDDVDVVWKLTNTQNGVCLRRELSRMSWVPEKVTYRLTECPLAFTRLADDWPAGTGEIANILDRLEVPLGAKARDAATALKDIGEGRRTELVLAALRWRRERRENAS